MSVTVRGVSETSGNLRAMGRRAARPQPAFEKIMRELERAHRDWFASQGRGTWPSLAPSTAARKRGRSRVLVDSGDLLRSLTSGGAGAIRRVDSDGFEFGTDVPYAHYHFGTRKMPRRDPIVPPDDRLKRGMTEEIAEHVTGRRW